MLELVEADRPVPREGEILVRVHAAGVNRVDSVVRRGDVPPPGELPYVPGWDSSGTVEAVGGGVSRFRTGDAVFGMFPGGAYAEYLSAPADAFAAKPAALSHVEAAGAPVAALTAWQALVEFGEIQPGQKVLVHAACGGVGHIAVQVAKARGAFVYGTTRGDHHDFLRSLGVDEPIDSTADDFAAVAQGVDLALDLVGGEYGPRTLATLRPGGLLISAIPWNPGFGKAAVKMAGASFVPFQVGPSGDQLAEVAELLADGRVKVRVAKVLPFAEAAKAAELIETGRTHGKVVLEVTA